MAVVATNTLFLLIASVCVVLVALVAAALVGFARRSPPLAVASLSRPGPFALQLPALQGAVDVWIRYSVSFPFERPFGAKTSRVFCLVVELLTDGRRMVFGHGGRHPRDTTDFAGIAHYMTSFSPGNATTPTRYSATVLVTQLPACPRTVQGVVHAGLGTLLSHAEVTVRRSR